MTKSRKDEDPVRVYRPHRGTFDGWRRYKIIGGNGRHWSIADGEIVQISHTTRTVYVVAGKFQSEVIDVSDSDEKLLLCELALRPQGDENPVHLVWTSEEEAQGHLLRFDKPPYFGGRNKGIIQAIVGIGLFGLAGLGLLIGCVLKLTTSNPPHVATILFIVVLGGVVCLFFIFGALTGIKNLYYYFRLPEDWRH